MNRSIMIGAVWTVVVVSLFGCTCSEMSEGAKLTSDSMPDEAGETTRGGVRRGVPNPAAIYCVALGHEFKVVEDEEGNQYGLCIFQDGNACFAWDFYRGKCGQEWSYCHQCGYDLKELGQLEGWFKGAICIDKTTKKEIGTVYDLAGLKRMSRFQLKVRWLPSATSYATFPFSARSCSTSESVNLACRIHNCS